MMFNLPDLNPAPIVRPTCRRCGHPLKHQNFLFIGGLVSGMWCWHCRKFNPESKP